MHKEPNIKSYLRVLILMFFLVPGCIKEHPVNPQPIDNTISDPLYKDQWHLKNTGQGGGTTGEDINVEPVWNSGNYGSSVYIAIVDDGLDTDHEDLYANVVKNLNHNYVTGYTTVYPGTHGTSVAGVAAAVYNNPYGGRGAAPDANIFNYNLLYSNETYKLSNMQDAMERNMELVSVSNNSWGPPDCSGQLDSSGIEWKTGVDNGITNGRGGKGIVYTWAAGNGGQTRCSSASQPENFDNSNYDGYANYYGVMAVAAVTDKGEQAFYSENGANIWISTYSNGGESGITTTDIMGSSGYEKGNYTPDFGGTSSAAPLAAGVVALILNANPDLTWRDVKIILAQTARKIDPGDTDWTANNTTENGGGGYNINHKYGFGVIDTSAAVELAKTWTNVGDMEIYSTAIKHVNSNFDNNITNNSITVTSSGITSIEYVAIDITIDHPEAGELKIILTSPGNTDSILAEKHTCRNLSTGSATSCSSFYGGKTFTFGSARNLGEVADGKWTLSVQDQVSGNSCTFTDWSLKFYGR